jgi:hypothetical protein
MQSKMQSCKLLFMESALRVPRFTPRIVLAMCVPSFLLELGSQKFTTQMARLMGGEKKFLTRLELK